MSTHRTPRPVLLLLLALVALLAPQSTKPAAPAALPGIARAIGSTHAAASTSSPRSGVEHQHSDRTQLRVATGPASAPITSTTGRNDMPAGPRLLLVQRPRPPTPRLTGSDLHAPTGRSPPSPAGT